MAQPRARCVGLLREAKSVWERRAALTPTNVRALVERGVDVLVQPSTQRVFPDVEYAAAGATLTEDLSPAAAILGVKEVPPAELLPDRTYAFFSHTIKAQPDNMPLLDALVDRNVRMVDIECITEGGEPGAPRLVAFGRYAGLAGMVDAQRGLGERLLGLGYSNPFLSVGSSYMYRDLEAARAAVRACGEQIAAEGTPAGLGGPLTFVFTGKGNVAQGAMEMFAELPHEMVAPGDLAEAARSGDLRKVYGCAVDVEDYILPRLDGPDGPAPYFADPTGSQWSSSFHEDFAPHASVIMNCTYWAPGCPRLLTAEQLRALEGRHRLLAVGDITCDVGGSIDFLTHTTEAERPFYVFDPATGAVHADDHLRAPGVLMMGVDILPAELPRDASEHFGAALEPFVEALASPLSEPLPAALAGATITEGGALTERYTYIADLRAETDARRHKIPAGPPKRVLVLGAGLVAPPLVDYLHGVGASVEQTLVSAVPGEAEAMAAGRKRIATAALDVSDDAALGALVADHDLVISLVPAPFHPSVARQCIAHGVDMVTASYLSPEMPSDQEAKDAGICIINEVGLDPGIDHMSAMAMIDGIKAAGGRVDSFRSVCGGLPAPECADNPLGYRFSWAPMGVLTAAGNAAQYLEDGELTQVPGEGLLDAARPLRIGGPALALECLPNRDSVPYREHYALQGARTVFRGTLRYESFSHIMSSLRALGLLANEPLRAGAATWGDVLPGLERPADAVVAHALEFLGLLDASAPLPDSVSAGDTVIAAFCELLKDKLAYEEGQRDMVLMQHVLEVTTAEGKRERHEAALIEYGTPGGYSAMAKTVAVPTAIAAALVLDGTIDRKGVFIPVTPDVYEPILSILKEEGIGMVDSVYPLA